MHGLLVTWKEPTGGRTTLIGPVAVHAVRYMAFQPASRTFFTTKACTATDLLLCPTDGDAALDNGAAYGTARVWEVKGPNFDAFAVRVLRDHGLLILGKTVTTEFAWTMIGRNTKNPHKHSHSPGGSSSGSAAAVANYECPIAVGSQTFGSIIRPASYCGVYGFKPTHGAVSTEGMKGFAPSLDSVGFFSRSVADMQALAGMFRLEDEREATFKGLKGAKLAWVKGPAWGKATESAKDALDKAVRLLAKHGAAVEELNLDARYDKTLSDHRIIATKELSRNVDTDYTEEELCPDRMLLDFIDEGNSYTIAEYKNAQNRYEALRPRFDDLSSGYEAILTLSATGEAPKGLAFTGDSSMNSMWTVSQTHELLWRLLTVVLS